MSEFWTEPMENQEQPARRVQWSLRAILAAVTAVAAWFAWWRLDRESAYSVRFFGVPIAVIFFCRRILHLTPIFAVALAVLANTGVVGAIGFYWAYRFTFFPPSGMKSLVGSWSLIWVMTLVGAFWGAVLGLAVSMPYAIYLWSRNRLPSRQAKPESP